MQKYSYFYLIWCENILFFNIGKFWGEADQRRVVSSVKQIPLFKSVNFSLHLFLKVFWVFPSFSAFFVVSFISLPCRLWVCFCEDFILTRCWSWFSFYLMSTLFPTFPRMHCTAVDVSCRQSVQFCLDICLHLNHLLTYFKFYISISLSHYYFCKIIFHIWNSNFIMLLINSYNQLNKILFIYFYLCICSPPPKQRLEKELWSRKIKIIIIILFLRL